MLGTGGMRTPQRFLFRKGTHRFLRWMQKFFCCSQQGRKLTGAFLDHDISASVLRSEAEAFCETSEQNYRKRVGRLANFGNEFQAIYRRHPVIRDDQIYRVVL